MLGINILLSVTLTRISTELATKILTPIAEDQLGLQRESTETAVNETRSNDSD